MKLVTVRERIVRYRTRRMSRSAAAKLWVKKYYPRKMTQTAIARKWGVTVQCVNEQAAALGLVGSRH